MGFISRKIRKLARFLVYNACYDYIKKIEMKEKKANLYFTAILELSKRYDQLIEKLKSLEIQINILTGHSERPEWLSHGDVYRPVMHTTYIKNKMIVSKTLTIDDPRDMYSLRQSIVDLVNGLELDGLSRDEKLDKIWDWVIRNISYIRDAGDEWRFPVETYYLRFGDCEDKSMLFVTMCRAAGFTSDEVFNAAGYLGDVCHAFPIVNRDGKWYVYETTLSDKPSSPKRLKGSNYKITLGVSNWEYYGTCEEQI